MIYGVLQPWLQAMKRESQANVECGNSFGIQYFEAKSVFCSFQYFMHEGNQFFNYGARPGLEFQQKASHSVIIQHLMTIFIFLAA